MSVNGDKIKAIIQKIWSKLPNPQPMSGNDIVNKIDEVYEAGKKAQNAGWWDNLISNRTDSSGALTANSMFDNFDHDNFYPPCDIVPYTITRMFYEFGTHNDNPIDLKARLEECGVKLDFSKMNGVTSYLFTRANISVLPILDFGPGHNKNLSEIMNGCKAEWIDKIIVRGSYKSSNNAFANCNNLRHVIFEPVDANAKLQGTWNFSYSPLDVESTKSIIAILYDYSGTDEEGIYSILFPETSWEALEADSVAPDGGAWRAYAEKLGYLT